MADYRVSETEEENDEIKKFQAELLIDPDKFETWEKLIRTCESLEGGLNRNSSPQSIALLRASYDEFLAKFPLLFGYWKKYADLEFSIGGTEAAEMVYERGVASIPNSVDLWTNYCGFKVDTSHDYDVIREFASDHHFYKQFVVDGAGLFERGATFVGLDFLAHVFWDKYLEFEERAEAPEKVFAILHRVVHIPMHQYARYFERFRQLAHSRPVTELLPADTLAQFRQDIDNEASSNAPPGSSNSLGDTEIEQQIRTRVDNLNLEIFNRTQTETMKRWQYESEIKRPYFVVTELDEAQLVNWERYLDFEEMEGGFQRVVFLYERCLVTCAFYDQFWYRYVRWMSGQPGKKEEARNIYQRASTVFVPIGRPGIRLQYAKFEEADGRFAVAVDIHKAILDKLAGNLETIVSLAHLQRRHNGLEAGIKVLSDYINGNEGEEIAADQCDMLTKGALATTWARMLWKNKGSPDEARLLYQSNKQYYLGNRWFWMEFLKFELDQPTSAAEEKVRHQLIKQVVDDIRQTSTIPPSDIKFLVHLYMVYLDERNTTESVDEYMTLDSQVNGPFSVQKTAQARLAADGKDVTTAQRMIRENGHPGVDVDDHAIRRGENPYSKYYQEQGDRVAEF